MHRTETLERKIGLLFYFLLVDKQSERVYYRVKKNLLIFGPKRQRQPRRAPSKNFCVLVRVGDLAAANMFFNGCIRDAHGTFLLWHDSIK